MRRCTGQSYYDSMSREGKRHIFSRKYLVVFGMEYSINIGRPMTITINGVDLYLFFIVFDIWFNIDR